jgi:hypothetical protein
MCNFPSNDADSVKFDSDDAMCNGDEDAVLANGPKFVFTVIAAEIAVLDTAVLVCGNVLIFSSRFESSSNIEFFSTFRSSSGVSGMEISGTIACLVLFM